MTENLRAKMCRGFFLATPTLGASIQSNIYHLFKKKSLRGKKCSFEEEFQAYPICQLKINPPRKGEEVVCLNSAQIAITGNIAWPQ